MIMDVGMSNPPPSRTKDFFASPALSLSLAGVFRGAAPAPSEVEEGDEESGGGCRDDAADISSENTGHGRSEDDADVDGLPEEEGDDKENKKKKRKRYHRHTADQIREMEALFKESPHPDEKQRQQLSKQLGLAPRQVKFWFQNRRTQIKAIQERHENSLLKSEMDKLKEENRCMRETIKKACCPNCGFATSNKDSTMTTEEQQLRIEIARLKAEIEKLRGAAGKFPGGTASPSSSCSAAGDDQENRSSLDYYTGFFGIEKSRILEIVNHGADELTKMATAGEPLWIRSVETGREILNYDEYVREFSPGDSTTTGTRRSIEASRETGVVFLDINRLVQAFMDVNQWREMFPFMISKAATVDVIRNGEGENRNGAVQLMFEEVQMLTPMVPTREVYFVRHCKQLSPESWAIVDVSIDKLEDSIDASLGKCRKRPSGCIIQDKLNGHCKVIWVEHLECQKSTIHSLYRSIVSSGLAFGAKHWMATLQLHCERFVFFVATNVPTKDSNGVSTLAGRKSILKLAQRMTWSFCRAIGASSYHTWTKLSMKGGDDIRVASRKNLNDLGEPQGVILCAVSSVWLPVAPLALFDFLRDDARRNEWDIMSTGGPTQAIANLAKGQDRGNSVVLHAAQSKESSMWILQDSCTNAFESTVVYAPVDIASMQLVMTGRDSSSIALLPSGFSILPDGLEERPLVITSRPEERAAECGSLLTVAFQILANASPTAKLTMESVETVNTLISCTLQNIKTSLKCEDG
ncbi:homeobox-leucine zipper protein GLABRA 2 [Magnolia sinica]|uniref:homeobox-leucine zipper protein GLABRA 2 n=1 Tax=Magnolia sinica TaxID=86752 RepID=UPI00265B1ABD|nr:homeobox-leucine zipper protein GLABRA 2 [Magnolia sinica]